MADENTEKVQNTATQSDMIRSIIDGEAPAEKPQEQTSSATEKETPVARQEEQASTPVKKYLDEFETPEQVAEALREERTRRKEIEGENEVYRTYFTKNSQTVTQTPVAPQAYAPTEKSANTPAVNFGWTKEETELAGENPQEAIAKRDERIFKEQKAVELHERQQEQQKTAKERARQASISVFLSDSRYKKYGETTVGREMVEWMVDNLPITETDKLMVKSDPGYIQRVILPKGAKMIEDRALGFSSLISVPTKPASEAPKVDTPGSRASASQPKMNDQQKLMVDTLNVRGR